MKKWFKDNMRSIVLSSLLILLPMVYGILLWNELPDTFITHWGPDGIADSTGGKVFAVFGIPAIFLVINLLCVFCTYLDKNNREKNQKAMRVVFWFMPVLSVMINCIIYKTATSESVDFFWLFPAMIGVLFMIMGNYMPKIEKNRTLGIKIFWTLANEENWNKTHRLAGRIWIAGGALVLVSTLLPLKWSVAFLIVAIFVMILIPYLYSYSIYCKHKQQGIIYLPLNKSKAEKNGILISAITVPITLIFVIVLMVTGSISYEFTDNELKIDATYGSYSVVGYEDIDTIEYREDFDFGVRNFGFASAKLSTGNFMNDEFGNYTLYAYNGSDSAIVIKSGQHIMVITGENAAETKTLFETLQSKID